MVCQPGALGALLRGTWECVGAWSVSARQTFALSNVMAEFRQQTADVSRDDPRVCTLLPRALHMTIETLARLLVFLAPLAYSPGPGNAFFAAIGASRGLRAAAPALAGYHLATFIVTALIGVGMGVTILKHPVVAKSLAAVGSSYVLWLAWSFTRAARRKARPSGDSIAGPGIGFWAGVVVLVLNPKAYYIIAVMFTQFLRPLQDDVFTVLAITTVFTMYNLLAFVIWAVAGRILFALFRGECAGRLLDYLFAALLIGVAGWMALPLFTG